MALYYGPMQCFCKAEAKAGKSKSQVYSLFDDKGKKTYSVDICLDYSNDKKMSKLYGLSITGIIICINVILKKLILKMVKWIGFATISFEMGIIV